MGHSRKMGFRNLERTDDDDDGWENRRGVLYTEKIKISCLLVVWSGS